MERRLLLNALIHQEAEEAVAFTRCYAVPVGTISPDLDRPLGSRCPLTRPVIADYVWA